MLENGKLTLVEVVEVDADSVAVGLFPKIVENKLQSFVKSVEILSTQMVDNGTFIGFTGVIDIDAGNSLGIFNILIHRILINNPQIYRVVPILNHILKALFDRTK